MAHDEQERREQRASELTPEERAAGSDDPEAQAGAVLAESDEREKHSRDDGAPVEHRGSDGTDR
ncbi:MAG: hypothetical protein ACRDZY_12630 [Acidimicrobiales bacterium]